MFDPPATDVSTAANSVASYEPPDQARERFPSTRTVAVRDRQRRAERLRNQATPVAHIRHLNIPVQSNRELSRSSSRNSLVPSARSPVTARARPRCTTRTRCASSKSDTDDRASPTRHTYLGQPVELTLTLVRFRHLRARNSCDRSSPLPPRSRTPDLACGHPRTASPHPRV